jgi:hypothetical protein
MKRPPSPPFFQQPLVPPVDPVGEFEHSISRWATGIGRTSHILAKHYSKAKGIDYPSALRRIERSISLDPLDVNNATYGDDWVDAAVMEIAALESSLKGVRK